MRIEVQNPEAVVKRAFWLAWQACGGTFGAGFLQDNPGATEGEVWKQVFDRADYPGGNDPRIASNFHNKPGKVHGDYVFGRMMKLGLEWDDKSVTFRDSTPRPDYQSWCKKYASYKDLVDAAIESLSVPVS